MPKTSIRKEQKSMELINELMYRFMPDTTAVEVQTGFAEEHKNDIPNCVAINTAINTASIAVLAKNIALKHQ